MENYSESREEILVWASKHSTYSFGVTLAHCSESYIVLDVDVKNGKDGFDSLQKYADYDETDLNITFAMKTPSGGMHYWFKSDSPLKSKLGALIGIDLLGFGRRVIAPWSISTEGNKYEVSQDLDVQVTG